MFVCHFSGLKRAAWLRTCVRIVLVFLSRLTLEPSLHLRRIPTFEIFTTGHQFYDSTRIHRCKLFLLSRYEDSWFLGLDRERRRQKPSSIIYPCFIFIIIRSFGIFVRIFVDNKIHSVERSSGDWPVSNFWYLFFCVIIVILFHSIDGYFYKRCYYFSRLWNWRIHCIDKIY